MGGRGGGGGSKEDGSRGWLVKRMGGRFSYDDGGGEVV